MASYDYRNSSGYNQPQSLLPNLVFVPKEAPKQFEKSLQDAGEFTTNWLRQQVPLTAGFYYATGVTPGQWIGRKLSQLGSWQPVANAIATFGATRFGAPLLDKTKAFSKTPVAKVAAEMPDDIASLLLSLRNQN